MEFILKTGEKTNLFQLPNNVLRIKHNPFENIKLKIPIVTYGGNIIGIKNKNFLRSNLANLLRLEMYKISIGKYLKISTKHYQELFQPWIRKTEDFFNKIRLVNSYIINEVARDSPAQIYHNLLVFINSAKESYINLRSFVDVLVSYSCKDTGLYEEAKRLLLYLPRTERLVVEPELETVQFYDNRGFSMKFSGSFCVHQLCFPSLDDVRLTVSPDKEMINIRGNLKAFNASKRLRFNDNDTIHFMVNKYSKMFLGSVTGSFILFDNVFPLKITFDVLRLRYQSFVKIGKIFEDVEISHSGNYDSLGWKDLVKSISGEISGTAHLQSLVEQEAAQISNHTQRRLEKADMRKQKAQREYKDILELYQMVNKDAREASYIYKQTRSQYKATVSELKSEQIRYFSLLHQDAALVLIERDTLNICDLNKCNETCIPIMMCDVCQDELKIPTKKWNCVQTVENVRSSQLVEVDETCEEIKHLFRTIYTGRDLILFTHPGTFLNQF